MIIVKKLQFHMHDHWRRFYIDGVHMATVDLKKNKLYPGPLANQKLYQKNKTKFILILKMLRE